MIFKNKDSMNILFYENSKELLELQRKKLKQKNTENKNEAKDTVKTQNAGHETKKEIKKGAADEAVQKLNKEEIVKEQDAESVSADNAEFKTPDFYEVKLDDKTDDKSIDKEEGLEENSGLPQEIEPDESEEEKSAQDEPEEDKLEPVDLDDELDEEIAALELDEPEEEAGSATDEAEVEQLTDETPDEDDDKELRDIQFDKLDDGEILELADEHEAADAYQEEIAEIIQASEDEDDEESEEFVSEDSGFYQSQTEPEDSASAELADADTMREEEPEEISKEEGIQAEFFNPSQNEAKNKKENKPEKTDRPESAAKEVAAANVIKIKTYSNTDINKLQEIPQMDNQVRNRIIIFTVLIVLTILGILSWIFFIKPENSETENRALAKFPEFSTETFKDGEYFQKIDVFYSDTFPFRETLTRMNSSFRSLFGVQREYVQLEADKKLEDIPEEFEFDPQPEPEPSTSSPQNEGDEYNDNVEQPSTKEEPEAQPEAQTFDDLIVVGDTALELYGFNKSVVNRYVTAINNIGAQVGDNVDVYVLTTPTQVEFKLPEKYSDMASSQKNAIEYMKSGFSPKVKTVDVYETMSSHSDEYIYFRTDHHWTHLGAYYAYSEFIKAEGDSPNAIDSYRTVTYENFLGTFYNSLKKNYNPKALEDNPDTLTAYIPHAEVKMDIYNASMKRTMSGRVVNETLDSANKYVCFIAGDQPMEIITSSVKNGKKIAVIKDSYGNAFVPFLTDHFEEVHVLDMREFPNKLSDYVNKYGITDLMFLNYTPATGSKSHVSKLEKMA